MLFLKALQNLLPPFGGPQAMGLAMNFLKPTFGAPSGTPEELPPVARLVEDMMREWVGCR